MLDIDDHISDYIRAQRVARLATVDEQGQPLVVPICYAFDGARLYSPLDEKPKRVAPDQLKRVRNIERNPQVSLVIDEYSEDWQALRYVIIIGRAEMICPRQHPQTHAQAIRLLREKYPQYRAMTIDARALIQITPLRINRWAARKESI